MDYNVLFDLIPVFMAGYGLYALNRCNNELEVMTARASAILLIVCQSTWIHSYINEFQLVVSLADKLWTVFNSVTMLLIIIIANKKRK